MSTQQPPEQPDIIQQDAPPALQFLLVLHLLVNSAKIHQDNNPVLVNAVGQFTSIMSKLFEEEDDITILTAAGRFYVRQEKVVYRAGIAELIAALLEFFEKRRLRGLRFFPPSAEASVEDIAAFIRLLIASRTHDEPIDWLEQELDQRNITWAEPVHETDTTYEELLAEESESPPTDAPEKEQIPSSAQLKERSRKEKAVLTYGYAVNSLQEIAHKVCNDRKAGIKKALRMVHKMIDMVIEDNDVLLGLSTIRDYDDYTFTHSMNVAILSMCLGQRIGMSRKSLETLTLSAMFHDLGKIDVAKNILNKPGKLTDQEFKEMKNHSLYSVRRIALLKTSESKKAEMLLAPFEHHLKFDLTGYPQTPRKKPISLFGRIIAIADVFDAITAPRVYRPFAISPDRALSIMQEGSGKDFDPVLLKVFINMIGVYPIGTLLKFENGEMGLVAKYSGESDKEQDLWVQLLQVSTDGQFSKGELINLGPYDSGAKKFNRPIVESLHPHTLNIQPADFLL